MTESHPEPQTPREASKALVPFKPEAAADAAAAAPKAAASAGGAFLRRAWPYAAVVVAAGSLGWAIGQHAARDGKADAERASALGALEQRLGAIEAGPSKSDVQGVKTAIDILARRMDEIGRTQTAAAAQASARIEKAERETAQKLDRMVERLDRLEKQTSSQTPVSTINKSAATPAPAPTPVVAPAAAQRLPDAAERPPAPLRNYVLREVFRGGALVEGRQGMIEIYPGAELPGAGRVRSVERRDGKWVVVTSAGVIDAD